jgi:aminomethyltransferase
MVDFAGWDMPVQYGSIVEEHTAVRTAAGLFDISHMGRLSFGGPDALDLIQHVYTNDAAAMKDFQVRYGLVCNEQGGVRDDVLVYRWPYGWAMVVNASNRPKIVEWLARHSPAVLSRSRTRPRRRAWSRCRPQALQMCRGLTDADPASLKNYFAAPTRYRGKNCVLSRTGYTGEDGFEIMLGAEHGPGLWKELLDRRLPAVRLGARDTLRLEAAMPLYGHELNEETDPFQPGRVGGEAGQGRVHRPRRSRRRDDATLAPHRPELAGSASLARSGGAQGRARLAG